MSPMEAVTDRRTFGRYFLGWAEEKSEVNMSKHIPLEPEVPQVVNGAISGRVLSRRSAIGVGAAVAGVIAMPLPAAADAFSGSLPPSPSSGGTVYTGGNPSFIPSNYGFQQDYVDVLWSTSTAGGFGFTGANSPYAGNPVLFNYTIHRGGVLLAYGTALGSFGSLVWTGPGGQTAGWVSGTPVEAGRGYRINPWNSSNAIDIYVVDTAGERWKILNWHTGVPTWISY